MSSNLTLIGDVHGKLLEYHNIIKSKSNYTIVLGDFGFKKEHDWHSSNIDSSKHKVLFGNHDYYPYIGSISHSLGRFGYDNYKDMFFISGAYSIDRFWRTNGLDWFDDEELNFSQSCECIDLYIQSKPSIVISHDCPQMIRSECFGRDNTTSTSKLLQYLFEFPSHKPKLWVFGHHHKHIDIEINGCRFVCLEELECFDVDIEELVK